MKNNYNTPKAKKIAFIYEKVIASSNEEGGWTAKRLDPTDCDIYVLLRDRPTTRGFIPVQCDYDE